MQDLLGSLYIKATGFVIIQSDQLMSRQMEARSVRAAIIREKRSRSSVVDKDKDCSILVNYTDKTFHEVKKLRGSPSVTSRAFRDIANVLLRCEETRNSVTSESITGILLAPRNLA